MSRQTCRNGNVDYEVRMKSKTPPDRPIVSRKMMHGNPVITPDGVRVGRVVDLIMDLVDLRITFAIVDFGFGESSLGSGDERFALPFELLELDDEKHRFILRLSSSPFELPALLNEENDGFEEEFVEAITVSYEGKAQWN